MAQQDTVMINVVDQSVRSDYIINIAIINQPNPVKNYVATASEIRQLIQIPKYWITDSITGNPITARNFYEYFPDLNPHGGGGGGTITIDTQVLPNSTNAVQNKAIYSFVNSSVATNTAYFVGTYNSLADLEVHSDYPYDITNNDYGFVVGSDSSGNTKYERYKYNSESTDWQFEYTLNNSSFTAAEWATIQSGLTAADKTKYDGYGTVINSKPGLIESSGGEIFNSYTGSSKNSAYDHAHAEGLGTSASGLASHSEGVGTTASGDQSHAEGKNTTASGFASHTEGENTNATGYYAHAEGNNTTASGRCAHAEGVGTKATNVFSHAEGAGTTASGEYSHAEGTGTTASGVGSHTEGTGTTASNSQSHAEGQASKALGVCSHAEGNGTTAQGQSQHAEGEYNAVDNSVSSDNPRGTFAHIIGNGTSDSNRSNAYAIGWDGKIYQPSDPNANVNGVYLSDKQDKLTFDNAPTQNSTNPVTSGGVYTAIGNVSSNINSILDPMSESEYEQLVTKTNPLYFIYED